MGRKGGAGRPEPDILILGASGQVGSELQRQLPVERIIPRAREMLDITNLAAITQFIQSVKPILVINAAATRPGKHSNLDHWRVNAFAVDHLVKTCALNKVALIHLSTSDVFGRSGREEPFVELSPVAPVGEYASSKACGEHSLLALGQFPCQEFVDFKYWLVRTGLLYGNPAHYSQNFLRTCMERLIRSRTPLALPTTVKRSATYVPHLVQQLVWLTENYQSVPSGIYHIADQGDPSLYELVRQTRRRLDSKCSADLTECSRQEYVRSEQLVLGEVPDNGLLDCRGWDQVSPIRLPDWERGVAEFARAFRA